MDQWIPQDWQPITDVGNRQEKHADKGVGETNTKQRDGANQVEKQCPGKLFRRGLAAKEVAKGQRTQETTDDDRRAQYRAAYERDGLSYRDHLNTAAGETF